MRLKVFITGATGFVGNHLIDLLEPSGHTIYGTAFPEKPDARAENISYLDIRSGEKLSEAIKSIRPDWIFHLAAISNVSHSWVNKKETLETNIMGTFNLFEAARTFAPQARILYVSSSDVYGVVAPTEEALSEENSSHAMSPYAFTKMSGELLSKFYAQVENLHIVISRSFPHTGPGQGPDFVSSDWACQITQIEKGMAEPVLKVGNLERQRDFTDVRDVVRAYVLLMQKGRKGEVYNVCSGRVFSLEEILGTLLSLSSKKIEIQVDPKRLRKADIPFLVGDNRKIKRETSWEPKIPIKQSLLDLLEYWRKR